MTEKHDKELLLRIERLISSYDWFVKQSEDTPHEQKLVYGLRGLVTLANMVLKGHTAFDVEPWHVIGKNAKLSHAWELLLRLHDYRKDILPPYPFIMAFYEHDFIAQLDSILTLAALRAFDINPSFSQVSINVSAVSFQDEDFVTIVLKRLEKLELFRHPNQKIIFEIHESGDSLIPSKKVLSLFRELGVGFAIDDLGLTKHDMIRISELKGIADYIKIDRHYVLGTMDEENNLANMMQYIRQMWPDSIIIAEGVQSIKHAAEIAHLYPDIDYVQGLYLPKNHDDFQKHYKTMAPHVKIAL